MKLRFTEFGALAGRTLFAAAVIVLSAPLAMAQARLWEAPLVIRTYELDAPNPYPALLGSHGRSRPIYPYPLLDALTNRRVGKSYNAVYLENEYLRVTVLPELGGKLYAIYDKTARRDVLYTNHVVKYAMVGIRGAWTSGGVEWNFPDGHTLTTVSPVDYTTRTEAGGSAVVVVGDTERVQRMQWAVAIRLRPGRKVVETEVTLNNRREVPGRYWFWATAAAPAADDLRFVYPMREAYPHLFWPVFSFPKHGGVDVGTYREVTNALSLFARESRRDFFGVYYEKQDWGIAHVADRHELPGKKTWTWGTDEAGQIWVDKLTEKDGQYVEFQAGRFETQMEHEFIAPHRVEKFTEYWFPLDKLGGAFNKVTKDVALRVEVVKDEARITANASARFDDAELFIADAGKQIHSSRMNLSPATPFAATVKLPAPMSIVARVRAKDGRELVHYYTDSPPDGNPDFKPATRPLPDLAPTSAERAYLAGVAADKKSNEPAARAAYNEALKLDPGYASAHTALGLSYYRSGQYDRAAEHLEAALGRNRDAGDARYYLALVRRAQGRTGEAIEHLMWCVRAGHREPVARYVLGEMYLAAESLDGASEHLSQAVRLDPRDLKARTLLALAERLIGKLDQAQARINAVVDEMPIDYFALHEQSKIYRARGYDVEARRAANELWRLLKREPDAVLELAWDYAAVGRRDEFRSILEEAVAHPQSGPGKARHPLLHYALGFFYERNLDALNLSGSHARAYRQFALGAQGNPTIVFPHRVEEVFLLRSVFMTNPDDGRAAYYLGNALASLHRDKEALTAWRQAVKLDPANVVARRNLARALWLVDEKKTEAAAEYEQAIKSAPVDFRLYVEFDQLLGEMKETGRRVRLLEGAPAAARSRPALLQSLAAAYVDAGRFADAIAVLEKNAFVTGEGELSALSIYRRAHLGLAREHQRAQRHKEAALEFLKATDYPANLGVGRPATQSHAREYVAAAREFEAAGVRGEAEKWWRRAAEEPLKPPSQPEEPWSEHYYFKAGALDRVGRKDEARALYERLAALSGERRMNENEPLPPRGVLRFVLAGLGLKALGQRDEARAAFEQALQLEPTNERARAELDELRRERAAGGQTGK
jgi:tetratricopeptide (TPR) repeat protein